MDITTYKTTIQNNFNMDRFYKLVKSMGKSLNRRKDRFDKSDIIEYSFEIYSNNFFTWVDEEGYDLLDKHNNKVEVKFQENCMFSEKRFSLKKFINIKLKNNLGTAKTELTNPAEYYLFAQSNAIAIAEYSTVSQFLMPVSDGIMLQMPTEHLTFVYTPAMINMDNAIKEIDYKKMKQHMLFEVISEV